jgi:hypothetical protein
MARIFLLKFEVGGASYKCSCDDDIQIEIQIGVNVEWIQLTEDGEQVTSAVNMEINI